MVITLAEDVDLSRWFLRLVDSIDDAVEGAVQDTVEFGEDAMKNLIEHSGTGGTWDESWDTLKHATPGRYQSYPGRVASGDMLNAVRSEHGSTGPSSYEGAFGWLGAAEPYWLAQEHGFQHNISREQIEGMNAIAQAADLAGDFLDTELDRRLRSV